ncbi:glycerate kinase [Microscilla marina ATCC 23134]|uniref:Glycerate kinase n=1 Tax=Microscilla marina ATCC 23134 TaxID=313606 RepID=A1ZH49_MICM2|nr:glycerate kinase [Microscilla marina]EAY30318.1 glycerate kinase [Microscilla marina ATCC 23134]
MKVIIAPDSFKDSLSATQVAKHIHQGIKQVAPSIETLQIPMADGGEGTMDILTQILGGVKITVNVLDPLLRPVKASFGWVASTNTAIIEMAQASGIQLLTQAERNPLFTSSYGTGQLIVAALQHQCKRILICIGGSATNDVGCGMLQALGVKFKDNQGSTLPTITGQQLTSIHQIDIGPLSELINGVSIEILNDVTNPLYGTNGATQVYAPQKGATTEVVCLLEKAIIGLAHTIFDTTGIDIQSIAGAGAAGGIGGALKCFLQGSIMNGVQSVMDAYKLEEVFKQADAKNSLVITGEGKLDTQSSQGKVISGVAQLAKNTNCL